MPWQRAILLRDRSPNSMWVCECYADVRELLVHFAPASEDDIEEALRPTLSKFEHQTGIATELAQRIRPLARAGCAFRYRTWCRSNVRKHAQHARQVRAKAPSVERRGAGRWVALYQAKVNVWPTCRTWPGIMRANAHRALRQRVRAINQAWAPPCESPSGTSHLKHTHACMTTLADSISILVVDDHLFRRGPIALLEQDSGLRVVGEAADAALGATHRAWAATRCDPARQPPAMYSALTRSGRCAPCPHVRAYSCLPSVKMPRIWPSPLRTRGHRVICPDDWTAICWRKAIRPVPPRASRQSARNHGQSASSRSAQGGLQLPRRPADRVELNRQRRRRHRCHAKKTSCEIARGEQQGNSPARWRLPETTVKIHVQYIPAQTRPGVAGQQPRSTRRTVSVG